MYKFKKIIALGLAAIAAVSAMSMSAMAAEDDDIVISVMDSTGSLIDYTQEDIDNLGGEIPAYGGATVMLSDEIPNDGISLARAKSNTFLSSTPSGTYFNIYNATFEADFSVPSGKTYYSSRRMDMSAATVSSASVRLYVTGAKDDDGKYLTKFNKKLEGQVYVPEVSTSTPFIKLSVNTNASVTMENMDVDYTYYMGIKNSTGSTATGTASLGAF